MKVKEQEKMYLPRVKVDDLFTSQKDREEQTQEKVQKIPLELIDDVKDNPFKIREQDEEFKRTVESIAKVRTNTPCNFKTKRKW